MIRLLAVVLSVSLLLGCGTPGSTHYTTAEVGKPVEMAPGRVVSSRLVTVEGDSGVVGPAAGGALGGAGAGWGFQSGWAAVIGAVVGAGAGYLAQNAVSAREGFEYVVQMSDGRVLTLVQNRESGEWPIADGTPVLVQLQGAYSRVLVDPRATAATSASVPPPLVTSAGTPGTPRAAAPPPSAATAAPATP